MMTSFYKTLICILLISLSVTTYGEKIVPPVLIAELPTDIKSQSQEELASLMVHIAGWSYQVLLDVPKKGLKSQQKSIEQVITLRKWLQAQQHPLFQVLAFHIITGTNKAILGEVIRQEMAKHGIAIGSPSFIANSFDDSLLKRLLSLNNIDAQEVIQYVINLDGKIANHSRQKKFSIEEYMKGLVLNQFSSEIRTYAYRIEDRKFLLIFEKLTSLIVSDLLFVQGLGAIDKNKDVNLLVNIYFETGFPNNRKDIKNLVQSKLSQNKRIRVSTGFYTDYFDVMNTLYSHNDYESPLGYGVAMTFLFFPFIEELDVIPTQYSERLPKKFKTLIGQWLTFKEDK